MVGLQEVPTPWKVLVPLHDAGAVIVQPPVPEQQAPTEQPAAVVHAVPLSETVSVNGLSVTDELNG